MSLGLTAAPNCLSKGRYCAHTHVRSIPVVVVDLEGYFSWAKQIRVAVRNMYETCKYGSNNDIRDRS